MIAVTLPAHNEEQLIAACLQSLKVAALHPALRDEQVVIVVALDRCSDATGWICERFGVEVITVDAGCVGVARAAASERALALGARWIGCTDADSVVPPDWLARQLQCSASAFCGVVAGGARAVPAGRACGGRASARPRREHGLQRGGVSAMRRLCATDDR